MEGQQLPIIDLHGNYLTRYGCHLFAGTTCSVAAPVGRSRQAGANQNDEYTEKFWLHFIMFVLQFSGYKALQPVTYQL